MSETMVQDKEFQSLMKQVTKLSRKQPQESITRRLFHTTLRAMKATPKADKLSIMSKFAVGKTVALKKVGSGFKRTGRKSTFGNNNIYKIINADRRRNHKPPLKRAEALGAARREIAKRMSSIGTLKAGFVRGIKQLALASGSRFSTRERKRIAKHSTTEIPHTRRERFNVWFRYNLVGRNETGNSSGVPRNVQHSISKSVNIEKQQMAQRIGKEFAKKVQKLSKGFKVFGI